MQKPCLQNVIPESVTTVLRRLVFAHRLQPKFILTESSIFFLLFAAFVQGCCLQLCLLLILYSHLFFIFLFTLEFGSNSSVFFLSSFCLTRSAFLIFLL